MVSLSINCSQILKLSFQVVKFNSEANTLKVVLLIITILANVTNQAVYLTLKEAESKATQKRRLNQKIVQRTNLLL